MHEVTFTLSVDVDLKENFTTAAREAGCDAAQVIKDFMADYVNRQHGDDAVYQDWLRGDVQVGLDEDAAGDVISNEEVEAESIEWRAQLRKKLDSAHTGTRASW